MLRLLTFLSLVLFGQVGVEVPEKPKEEPATIRAVCTRVLDGDTIQYTKPDGSQGTVRLFGVDAPEMSQRFGKEARDRLEELVLNHGILVIQKGEDRYERELGEVYAFHPKGKTGIRYVQSWKEKGKHFVAVQEHLLEDGLVWHFTKYSDSAEYQTIQNDAKEHRRGIWQDARRVAPWDFRNGARVETAIPRNVESIRETDTKVYITRTGSKYHRAGCRYLSKSKIEIPLSRAQSAYTPCSKCRP
jgi:endonuclease YncB( thermonuclease family)